MVCQLSPSHLRSLARAAQAGLVGLCLVTLLGCQGTVSRRPPIHPNPNMDQVKRYDAQEPSDFWGDGRAMRPRVEGTLPQGSLQEDDHYYRGQLADGTWASSLPAEVTMNMELLERGRARFEIYCTPCHDQTGGGKGSVALASTGIAPPSFHDQRLRALPVGEVYGVIANGVRSMPSYALQVPVADRWAIASYVKTLQLAGHAEAKHVPSEVKSAKGWGQ